MTESRTVVRPVRAPRLEVERVRSRLAAKLYGVAAPAPTIAHYEIVERIGFGAQGDVYLVHDPRLRRQLAVKVLRREVGREGIAEARALAQIVHPNVVQVFDVGVTKGGGDEGPRAYIVMEYVAGRSLQAWCEEATSWTDRMRVAIDAGRGLRAAHTAGIVHGDFKPSNVVVGDDGRTRVMDFGLARWGAEARSETGSEDTHRGGGTPGYRAPECDERPPDVKSDQYSFCVTAWRLLVELPVATGPGRRELAEVRSILQRGMLARAEDRWPDLEQLLDRLARRPMRRRGLERIAIAVGAIVLASWGLARATSPTPDRAALAPARLEMRGAQAELLLRLGREEWSASRVDEARRALERAAHLAGARGDDRISAEATVMLVDLLGRRLAAFDEARQWEPHARAAIARLDDRELAAKLDMRWGMVLALAGEHDAGRQVLHALLERLAADASITSVASVDVESALARVELLAGRPAESLAWAERAVAGQAARVGTEHPAYAEALVRLGAAQEQRSDLAAARETLEAALAIQARAGDEMAMLGTHNSLAIVLERQGDLDAAAREYESVLQAASARHMDDSVVMTRANLGSLALARHDSDAAVEHFTVARTLAETIYPPDHRLFVTILFGLGTAYGRRSDPERAVPLLERSLELAVTSKMAAGVIGKHRYVLGQARWLSAEPEARARGYAEVQQGLAELEGDREAYREEIAEAQAWLRARDEQP